MSKPITKITVHCPHCGAQQQEPELAKSTFCRKCSEYFAITPAALSGVVKSAAVGPSKSPTGPAASTAPRESSSTWSSSGAVPSAAPEVRPAAGGFRKKLEEMLGSKPRMRTASCFECNSWHEVSSSAQSTTCKACGAYIDLQDYKISGSFSRNIKTRGTLYLGSKGDLSSSKIVCSEATLHGKMRGNLTCSGKVMIRVQGRLYGSVEAGQMILEKGSDVVFSRPVRAGGVEIHGKMTGQIVAESHVTVFKSGSLDGAVDATGFTVERGGCFQGELTITPKAVTGTSTAEAAVPSSPETTASEQALGGEQNPALG